MKVVKQRIERRLSKLIITPQLEDWLESDGEGMGVETEEDLALARKLLLASKNNNKRSGRFGASSRGRCERQQIYAFLGMPKVRGNGFQLQNIFNDGTFRHIRWQLMLQKAGITTDVEVPFKAPEWRLSTSLDGEHDRYPWMFELKGMGQGKYPNRIKNPEDIPHEHMLQMHTCMFAIGWDTAIYIAESKALNMWAEVVVPRDEGIINEVTRELTILNEAVENQELPEIQDSCRFRKGDYKDCPYGARCLKHHSEGSAWPDDERWPGDESTSVSIGKRG